MSLDSGQETQPNQHLTAAQEALQGGPLSCNCAPEQCDKEILPAFALGHRVCDDWLCSKRERTRKSTGKSQKDKTESIKSTENPINILGIKLLAYVGENYLAINKQVEKSINQR